VVTALPLELEELDRIVQAGGAALEVRTLCSVGPAGEELPVTAVCLGNPSPSVPAVGYFGGVHGLERIGAQVVLSFLGSLVARLHWDEMLHAQLQMLRLVFIPVVNPIGMRRRTRASSGGVDLMRNAPIESDESVPPLVGGHRWSPRLPFYRGPAGAPMEPEGAALCDLVRSEMLSRPFSIAIDCHSGFGTRDRIWFPYAHTRKPFARLAEVHALSRLFDGSHPAHPYVFEPQCRQYLTHGDLWDYLSAQAPPAHVFLPLTLEMGSWRWVRKQPSQILSRLGIFNPLPADRLDRVRRNHLLWLGYLCRAGHTWREWLPTGDDRVRHEARGLERWFGGLP